MLGLARTRYLLWVGSFISVITSTILPHNDLDGLLSLKDNVTVNLINTGKTGVKLQWKADGDSYGVLKPTSMYMTGIQALYDLCLQDWGGMQGPITYKFRKFADMEIQIMPFHKVDGRLGARRWATVIAIFRTMATMDDIMAYTGGVNILKINGEPEVSITFKTSNSVGAQSSGQVVQEIRARSPAPGVNLSEYSSDFEQVRENNASATLLDEMYLGESDANYYVDWYGVPVRPNQLFMTMVLAIVAYGPSDKDSIARPYETGKFYLLKASCVAIRMIKCSLDYPLHILAKQYYGPDPPAEFADRQMTVKEALRGIRMIARTAVKMAKFQEMVMVMERVKGIPVGEFNISQSRNAGPPTKKKLFYSSQNETVSEGTFR